MTTWRDKLTILSGGQRGADCGALWAARAFGIKTGGYAPRGYRTEEGESPWLADYGLIESSSRSYPERTMLNCRLCDACLWLGDINSAGGRCTRKHLGGKPLLVVRSDTPPGGVALWISQMLVGELAILAAGNRESVRPGIGKATESYLKKVFAILEQRECPTATAPSA